MFQVGKAHSELEKVTSLLDKIRIKGEETDVTEEMDPAQLLPGGGEGQQPRGGIFSPLSISASTLSIDAYFGINAEIGIRSTHCHSQPYSEINFLL